MKNTQLETNSRVSMKKTKSLGIGKLVAYIMLTLWAFTTIYPLVWVLMNSFKPSNDIILNSFNLPSSFNLMNYKNAFTKMSIGRGYVNSLIISGTVVVFVVLFGGLAAYILARFEFKGKKVIYTALLGSLLFPAFATVVPVFVMLYKMNLINKHVGLILPQVAGNLSFAIIVLMGFMKTIPMELEEAGIVEGCNTWQVYTKIIAPISKSSFATVAIFTFLWSYNDLFLSLIILRTKSVQPINVLLNEISSQYGTDYGLMTAVIAIIIIPVMAVYLAAQQFIIKGLTAGAIKG